VSRFRSPAPPGGEAPRFYSVAQVAAMLGMSSMTLYRAIGDGEFPAVRIRGRLIVPARAIDAMAEAAVADRTVVDAAGFVPVAVRLP
jgi:excisionase family DNA binding protein